MQGLGEEVEGPTGGGGFGGGTDGEVVGAGEGVVGWVYADEAGGEDEGLVEGDVGYFFDLTVCL